MASMEIHGVYKYFGGVEVIRGVNIDIRDGEFTVLVGPSGCGKSTLLRMLSGLEEISEGEVRIGGKVVNNMLPKQRDIAMVFQNYALYPHMTVYNNMAFSLALAKYDKSEIRNRVEQAAKILGLNELLQRYPRQLSGGQQQRVAMGRAIVRNPQAFLFDEPLSNLDAKLRVRMRTEIRALHQRLRTTSVYVTHDQIEAMTMGDEIVVMHDGIVEQHGAPLDLYDNPENLFVAEFIGSPSMNFLPGVVRQQNANIMVELADGSSLPAPARSRGIVEGQRVVYGVRPEHLNIGSEEEGIKTTVTVIEPTGAETEVHTRFGENELVSMFRERHSFNPGETVFLSPDRQRAHLFDAETEKALA
jgi:multiple sugar transport system ATP-binding protein